MDIQACTPEIGGTMNHSRTCQIPPSTRPFSNGLRASAGQRDRWYSGQTTLRVTRHYFPTPHMQALSAWLRQANWSPKKSKKLSWL